jgi:hypothetical protein
VSRVQGRTGRAARQRARERSSASCEGRRVVLKA